MHRMSQQVWPAALAAILSRSASTLTSLKFSLWSVECDGGSDPLHGDFQSLVEAMRKVKRLTSLHLDLPGLTDALLSAVLNAVPPIRAVWLVNFVHKKKELDPYGPTLMGFSANWFFLIPQNYADARSSRRRPSLLFHRRFAPSR